MRTILFSIISLYSLIPASTAISEELDMKDLKILYGPAFESFKATGDDELSQCCSYGYVRPGDDQFYEGFGGLFQYAGYSSGGVEDLLNRKGKKMPEVDDYSFYNIQHYEELAGVNMFLSKTPNAGYVPWLKENQKSYEFEHYNPAFIKWVTNNLIPPSDFSIKGVTAKYVYSHYSRFMRLLTESYLYLKSSGTYEEQAQKYIEVLKKADQEGYSIDGLEVLSGMYYMAIPGYEVPSESEIPSPFEPHMAFGFWLRRSLDGTHNQIFDGISIIMERFDSEWFENIQKKY